MLTSQLRVEVHDYDKIGSSNFLGEITLSGSEMVRLPASTTDTNTYPYSYPDTHRFSVFVSAPYLFHLQILVSVFICI